MTDIVRLVPLPERVEKAEKELLSERTQLILDFLDEIRDAVKRGQICSIAVAYIREGQLCYRHTAAPGMRGALYATTAAGLDRIMRELRG